jgi:hypothetical protein
VNGRPKKIVHVGNAPELTLTLTTGSAKKFDSTSGNRLQIGELSLTKEASLAMTLDEWTVITLGLGMYSSAISITGATVTDESIATALDGEFVKLAHQFVTDIAMVNSAGSPLTLIEGTHFRIESEAAGIIEFLQTIASPPVLVDYEYADADAISMFTTQPPIRFLILDGINTDNNERVYLELYKVKFNPVGSLSLITNEYGSIPLTATVLYDTLNAADANLGGFGRTLTEAPA